MLPIGELSSAIRSPVGRTDNRINPTDGIMARAVRTTLTMCIATTRGPAPTGGKSVMSPSTVIFCAVRVFKYKNAVVILVRKFAAVV